jgi:hypothetical protein
MFSVYSDFNYDAYELYAGSTYNECFEWLSKNLNELRQYDYSTLDIVELDPDKCSDDECSCHRYIGPSVYSLPVKSS